ncbi:type I polyketide synthase [Enterobacter quasiroggenkampii]|uniref:type I polyketide synthase n=1 Tax=Enterobacter quasiroggenkampii TaxID=2497436 RepID=UPI0021D01963|nr:type I polyketide synthase [Enterobacter quasiroggenkampii]MCU6346861.1 SDR family NAD(P)-dependent oxidoreductase [Enterobacter quasiroggenkampii]
MEKQENTEFDIAIIGMSCQFPGIDNIDDFWRVLINGECTVKVHKRKDELCVSGAISDVNSFDYDYFGISASEAQLLDPQHKKALESVDSAFKNAGYDPFLYDGIVGVFGGCGFNSYLINNVLRKYKPEPGRDNFINDVQNLSFLISSDKDFYCTRISYVFNFTGPSFTTQSACSTSLTSLHIGCQSLLAGEIDTAVISAATITVPDSIIHYPDESGVFSNDGFTRPFDINASGTTFSNGVATIILKRVEDAKLAGDRIYAIIKATSLNNDGNRNKQSFMSPSFEGQSKVINSAITLSGVDKTLFRYIECHGTATKIGDPIEVEALKTVFSEMSAKKSILIGSLKGNIGHLGWCSGLASLIKCALSLSNNVIPKTINHTLTNPDLNIENTNFKICNENITFQKNDNVYMGLSCFGIGGTNAHVVLSSYVSSSTADKLRRGKIVYSIPFDYEKYTIEEVVEHHVNFINELNDDALIAACRSTYEVYSKTKLINVINIQFERKEELLSKIKKLRKVIVSAEGNDRSNCCFVFPGQGGHTTINKDVYLQNVFYKQKVDELYNKAKVILKDLPSLNQIMEAENDALHFLYRQVVLFINQVSIYHALTSIGISPKILVGHSAGEISMACISGVLTEDDALNLVVSRSLCMTNYVIEGRMIFCKCPAETIKKLTCYQSEKAFISVINSESDTIISCAEKDYSNVKDELTCNRLKFLTLNISRPGHSPYMSAMIPSFKESIKSISFNKSELPCVNNLTSQSEDSTYMSTSEYWLKQILHPVDFHACIKKICQLGITSFIEISFENILTKYIKGKDNLFSTYLNDDVFIDDPFSSLIAKNFGAKNICYDIFSSHIRGPLAQTIFKKKISWIDDSEYNRYVYETIWLPVDKQKSLDLNENTILTYRFDNGRFHCAGEVYNHKNNYQIVFELNNHIVNYDELFIIFNAFIAELKKIVSLFDNSSGKMSIYVFTLSARKILESDIVDNFFLSAVWGAVRCFRLEHPDIQSYLIDTDEHIGLDHLTRIDFGSALDLAWRKGHGYFAERLIKDELSNNYDNNVDESDHNVLIIGGGSGIGFEVANYFSEKNNVVSISRNYKSRHDSHNIKFYYCDICDRDEFMDTLENVFLDVGHIDVVYFSAGVIADSTLMNVNETDVSAVFDVKVKSLLTLYDFILKLNNKPRKIVLFSSVSAVLGNQGQTAHASANFFQDVFAQRVNKLHGICCVTVNWGPWLEVGELVNNKTASLNLIDQGFTPHENKSALNFLNIIANSNNITSNKCYLDFNVEKYLAINNSVNYDFLSQIMGESKDYISITDENTSDKSPITYLQSLLIDLFSFSLSDLTPNTVVKTLGIDSLQRLRLRSRIYSDLNVSIPLELIHSDISLLELAQACFTGTNNDYISSTNSVNEDCNINKYLTTIDGIKDNFEIFPTSYFQKRWYNLVTKGYGLRQVPVILNHFWDEAIFLQSMKILLERHSSLSNIYLSAEHAYADDFNSIVSKSIRLHDLSFKQSELIISKEIKEICENAKLTPPNINKEVSWAMDVILLPDGKFAIILLVQHIDFDGESLEIFFKEFNLIYSSMYDNSVPELQPSISYFLGEYKPAQQREITSFFKGLFWGGNNKFFPNSHFGFNTPSISKRYTVGIHAFSVYDIKRICIIKNVTPFAFFLSVYYKALVTVFGIDDFIISNITSLRPLTHEECCIGPFTFPVPFRLNLKNHQGDKLLNDVELLVNEYRVRSDMDPSIFIREIELFKDLPVDTYFSDVSINFSNYNKTCSKDYKIDEILTDVTQTLFSGIDTKSLLRIPALHLVVTNDNMKYSLNFWYKPDVLSDSDIDRLSTEFINNFNSLLSE